MAWWSRGTRGGTVYRRTGVPSELKLREVSLPGYCSEVKRRANGTSGEGGVVICRVSGGGVRGAVEGSVVKAEKTGGVTNWVS
jgi:hypothetical protein